MFSKAENIFLTKEIKETFLKPKVLARRETIQLSVLDAWGNYLKARLQPLISDIIGNYDYKHGTEDIFAQDKVWDFFVSFLDHQPNQDIGRAFKNVIQNDNLFPHFKNHICSKIREALTTALPSTLQRSTLDSSALKRTFPNDTKACLESIFKSDRTLLPIKEQLLKIQTIWATCPGTIINMADAVSLRFLQEDKNPSKKEDKHAFRYKGQHYDIAPIKFSNSEQTFHNKIFNECYSKQKQIQIDNTELGKFIDFVHSYFPASMHNPETFVSTLINIVSSFPKNPLLTCEILTTSKPIIEWLHQEAKLSVNTMQEYLNSEHAKLFANINMAPIISHSCKIRSNFLTKYSPEKLLSEKGFISTGELPTCFSSTFPTDIQAEKINDQLKIHFELQSALTEIEKLRKTTASKQHKVQPLTAPQAKQPTVRESLQIHGPCEYVSIKISQKENILKEVSKMVAELSGVFKYDLLYASIVKDHIIDLIADGEKPLKDYKLDVLPAFLKSKYTSKLPNIPNPIAWRYIVQKISEGTNEISEDLFKECNSEALKNSPGDKISQWYHDRCKKDPKSGEFKYLGSPVATEHSIFTAQHNPLVPPKTLSRVTLLSNLGSDAVTSSLYSTYLQKFTAPRTALCICAQLKISQEQEESLAKTITKSIIKHSSNLNKDQVKLLEHFPPEDLARYISSKFQNPNSKTPDAPTIKQAVEKGIQSLLDTNKNLLLARQRSITERKPLKTTNPADIGQSSPTDNKAQSVIVYSTSEDITKEASSNPSGNKVSETTQKPLSSGKEEMKTPS